METLNDAVKLEMVKMMARRLDFAPSPEDLPMTIQVMVEDLMRRGLLSVDVDRVHAAFQQLGGAIQKWPTPLMIIEALPKRVTPESRRIDHLRAARNSNMDNITPQLRAAIGHKNKRNSVMLPGEGLGDYLKAYYESGLTRAKFDQLRLNPPETKYDPESFNEARLERESIQWESAED
jgi:hypothetical protein